uniref:Uncharacterized protein n=1 Tax=Cajanus cajan TaxID=3821 RepID=A0A151RNH0_CAJCA|nr:hypothetical protein KK1_034425 [Cajanus cajan]
MCWCTWKMRNQCVFEQGQFDGHKLGQQVLMFSWSWLSAFNNSFSYSFTQWQLNTGLCLLG